MSFQDIMKKARSKSCWKLNDNMVAKSVTPPIETKDVLAHLSQKTSMKPPMSPKAKKSPRQLISMSPKMSPKLPPKISSKMSPMMPPKNSMTPKVSAIPGSTKTWRPTPKTTEKVEPLTRRGSTTGPIGPNSDFSGGFYPIKKPKPKIEKVEKVEPIEIKPSQSPETERISTENTRYEQYPLANDFPEQTLYEYNPSSSVSDWLTQSDFDAARTPSSPNQFENHPIRCFDLQPRFEPPIAASNDYQPWQNEVAKDFCGGYQTKPKIELDHGPIAALEPTNLAPEPEAKAFNWQTSFDLANICHQKKLEAQPVVKPVAKQAAKSTEVSYPWRPQPKPMNSKPIKPMNFNESPINLCEVNLTSLIDESTSCYASQLIADLEEKMKQKPTPVFQPVVFNPSGFDPPLSDHVQNLTNETSGFQSEEIQPEPYGEQLEVTPGEEMTHPPEEVVHPEDAETVRKAPNIKNEPDAMALAKECFQIESLASD